MYRLPSSKRRIKIRETLNLVPILDAIFILIFFLLTSSQFLKIYELDSDLPIYSESPEEADLGLQSKQLNLTIKIKEQVINVFTGREETLVKQFFATKDKWFDLKNLNKYLVSLKKKYPKEYSVNLGPSQKTTYDQIVLILDEIKHFTGKDNQSRPLFNQVIFGNLHENLDKDTIQSE